MVFYQHQTVLVCFPILMKPWRRTYVVRTVYHVSVRWRQSDRVPHRVLSVAHSLAAKERERSSISQACRKTMSSCSMPEYKPALLVHLVRPRTPPLTSKIQRGEAYLRKLRQIISFSTQRSHLKVTRFIILYRRRTSRTRKLSREHWRLVKYSIVLVLIQTG